MRYLGLISDDEKDIRFLGSESRPKPPARIHCDVLCFPVPWAGRDPAHEFLRCLLFSYDIKLWQLTPNSIVHLMHVKVIHELCPLSYLIPTYLQHI
jgi:hypothetical protein